MFTGLGFCISTLPSAVIILHHFSANRTLASGLATLGFSAGNIVGPRITEFLLEHYGWKGTLLILSALVANRAPIGLTLWPPSKPHCNKDPKANHTVNKPKKSCGSVLKGFVDFSLFKHKLFSLFCVGSLLQRFYITAFINHLPSYSIYKGFSLDQAASLSSLLFISQTTTRLVFSFVSNMRCIHHLAQYTVGTLIGSCSILVLLLGGTYQTLLAAALVAGLYLGEWNT